LWETPDNWQVDPVLLDAWIQGAAEGLAAAILSASSLLELEAIIIDGWLPAGVRARLVAETQAAFARLDLAGLTVPAIREGSIGPNARGLGAAAIPLSQRYLLDPTAGLVEG
jgi:predicted NBD/HSP70 family sugar kinase